VEDVLVLYQDFSDFVFEDVQQFRHDDTIFGCLDLVVAELLLLNESEVGQVDLGIFVNLEMQLTPGSKSPGELGRASHAIKAGLLTLPGRFILAPFGRLE